MQVFDGKNKAYEHLIKSFQFVWKTEGLKGFYQGIAPALLATTLSWGGYFYLYEQSKLRKLSYLTSSSRLGIFDHVKN
jgi:solute carrier family 25 folate transporter 32